MATNPTAPAQITEVTDSVSLEGRVYTLTFTRNGKDPGARNSDGSVRL